MTVMQLDLLDFIAHAPPLPAVRAAPAPTVARPPDAARPPAEFPPRRSAEWEALVAAANAPLHVMAALLWTGEVVEVLSEHAERRRRLFLFRDGTIHEVAADPAHYRTVFVTLAEAQALHAHRPLICEGRGTHAARYRFGAAGEPVPPLQLPTEAA